MATPPAPSPVTGPLLGTARVRAVAMSLATERLTGMTPRLVMARLPAMVPVPDTDPARTTAQARPALTRGLRHTVRGMRRSGNTPVRATDTTRTRSTAFTHDTAGTPRRTGMTARA